MSAPRVHWLGLVVALLGASCGAPGEPPPEERASQRAPEELTPEERALLEAFEQGGEAWEEARAQALADPALERFLVDHLVLAMVRAYEGLARPGAAERRGEFDRAQAELVRLGERSSALLGGLLALSDGVVAALAATTLERIGRPALAPVVPLTRSGSARTRLRATEVLGRLPHAGSDEEEAEVRRALTDLARDDPEWTVRAQAARALGARGARDRSTEPARRILEGVLFDPDPAVSEAAARALAEVGDPWCVPALLRRLQAAVGDGELRAVRACQGALRTVTGGAAERDVAGWQRWWYEHRDELQRAEPVR